MQWYMNELNLLIIVRAIFFMAACYFLVVGSQEITISLRIWAAKETYYLGCWGLPRNVYYLAVEGCQGMSVTWRLDAAKECLLLGGVGPASNVYYLAVRIFSWRLGNFAIARVYLVATTPRKLSLAASCQGNLISLAFCSWRILLGGRPRRNIYLAVLALFLAVFGRQGNSRFW